MFSLNTETFDIKVFTFILFGKKVSNLSIEKLFWDVNIFLLTGWVLSTLAERHISSFHFGTSTVSTVDGQGLSLFLYIVK